MDKIEPYARAAGYEFINYNPQPRAHTGFGNLVANRLVSLRAKVYCVSRMIESWDNDIEIHIWCHSNGLAVSYLVEQMCPDTITSITSFNGALNASAKSDCPIHNFYYTKDFWLWLAKFRPGHVWGNYGANPDCGNLRVSLDGLVNGHSDFHNHLQTLAPMALEMMP